MEKPESPLRSVPPRGAIAQSAELCGFFPQKSRTTQPQQLQPCFPLETGGERPDQADRLAFWCGMLGLSTFGQAGRFTMDSVVWGALLDWSEGELSTLELCRLLASLVALEDGTDGA
jgi:hypothetical protein